MEFEWEEHVSFVGYRVIEWSQENEALALALHFFISN